MDVIEAKMIHFKDLRDYQKDAYGMAIMTAFLNNGRITTSEIERIVMVKHPELYWQNTKVTKELRSHASARFVVQALRGDGYLITHRIKGENSVEYLLTNKFREFFCRLGCYGEIE